jgi:hypothetical protein
MPTLTIRMPEDKANRLKDLARSRGISLNKLIEEWATMGIAEFDAQASFMARAARGSRERGLAALRTLDARDAAASSLHDSASNIFENKTPPK